MHRNVLPMTYFITDLFILRITSKTGSEHFVILYSDICEALKVLLNYLVKIFKCLIIFVINIGCKCCVTSCKGNYEKNFNVKTFRRTLEERKKWSLVM